MDGGGYALVVYLDRLYQIQVGRLGHFAFPEGHYLYFGSARGGLEARLARHFRMEKKLHWHIDYLLQQGTSVEAWYVQSEERLECLWAKAALGLPSARIAAPHFGASDCRCPAHLIYFSYRPTLEAFRLSLGSAGAGLRLAPASLAARARMSSKGVLPPAPPPAPWSSFYWGVRRDSSR